MTNPQPRSAVDLVDAARVAEGPSFRRGQWIGGAAAFVVAVAVALTNGITSWQRSGDFFELQARAWLDGRWDIDPQALGYEAFFTDDRAYMYFGPTPALMRLPLVAFTDRLDGRLTQLSMLTAFVVALIAAGWLHRLVRRLRTTERAPRAEAFGAGLLLFVCGAGSTLLYLQGKAWVYHEAIMWGVAFTLLAFASLVATLGQPSTGRMVATGLWSLLALGARPSIGLAPIIAIGVVLIARLISGGAHSGTRGWIGAMAGSLPRRAPPMLVLASAAVVAFAASVAINVTKFGLLYGIPVDRQYQSMVDPARQEFLARSGGTLFLAGAIPTNVWHWLRPDALAVQDAFPWIVTGPPATIIGNVPFDHLDRSTSVVLAMPLLLALTVVGIVVVFARARVATVRPILIGAALGGGVTLTIAYVAQRYQGDLLPFMIPAAIVGADALVARSSGWSKPRRVVGVAAVVALAAWSVAVNAATGIDYQRHGGPDVSASARAQYLGWQVTWPGGPTVTRADVLPIEVGADRMVMVVGDCEAVYQSNGGRWLPVELSAGAGRSLVALTVPSEVEPGTVVRLMTAGPPGDESRLVIEYGAGARARFVYSWDGDGGGEEVGRWQTLRRGTTYELDATFDAATNVITITEGDRAVFDATYFHPHAPMRWTVPVAAPTLTLCSRL